MNKNVKQQIKPTKTISIEKMEKSCVEVSQILKSLSHPMRLMILGHLVNGAKTVTELVEVCDISQSQASQFLTRMTYEGLVNVERQGKYRIYSLADKKLLHLLQTLQKEYC